MTDQQIGVTSEEREYLTKLLKSLLNEKRVEEHRTRAPSYRGIVVHEEELMTSILSKLGANTA